MSKSNNIVKWDIGNNIVDSGISISSIGSGLVADNGLITTINTGGYTENISHSLGKTPKILNFNGIMIYTPTNRVLATSSGSYYNGNNKSIYGSALGQSAASGEASTTYCINMPIVSLPYYLRCYVSSIGTSTFTLTYDNNFVEGQHSRMIHWTALA